MSTTAQIGFPNSTLITLVSKQTHLYDSFLYLQRVMIVMDSKEEQQGKRLKSSDSDIWSQINGDVFRLILQWLSRTERIRLSTVCSLWLGIVREYISSQSCPRVPPWLLLPSGIEEGEDIDGCRFYSFDEGRFYKRRNSLCKDFGERFCIGSSHGWLILLDERVNPYLLNPFSGIRIPLPPFIIDNYSSKGEGEGYVLFNGSKLFMSVKELRDGFYYKSILSSSPFDNNNEYGVILIYDNKSKLAYAKHGEWRNLDSVSQGYYCDVIYCNNRVYALSTSTGCSSSIEIWDFGEQVPVKLMQVTDPPLPGKLQDLMDVWKNKIGIVELVTNQYLVEYLGNIFLLVRFVLKDRLSYQTWRFRMCRFDFVLKKWIEVDEDDSLKPGCFLFVGRNHSISLSAEDFPDLQKHSMVHNNDFLKQSVPVYVFYADDWWSWIDSEGMHSGHDMGVMVIRSVGPWDNFMQCRPKLKPVTTSIVQRKNLKMEPTPLWILPNPW